MLRVISLGAGVQSTTLALMAAKGLIAPVDYAIFADTQSEPKAVYAHLEKLTTALPFPVLVVTKGSLRQEILDACEGKRGAWGRPPLFILNPDGTHGMTRRQCTQDYKLDVIYRKLRELAGVKPRSRGPKTPIVEQLIGISLDEAHRQKDARFRWIRNVYPLVELGITRDDCKRMLAEWGWPDVPKSSCTFCPYHDDALWLDMQRNDPEAFADAVRIDRVLRSEHGVAGFHGLAYLHAERRPLDEIDFEARLARARRRKQLRLYLPLEGSGFGNECEGMCGV